MPKLFVVILVVAVIIAAFLLLGSKTSGNRDGGRSKKKDLYQYKKRGFLLSRAEHECYDALMAAVGADYYIFPQVHLPTLVDEKIVGQNWRGAFRHISEKSIDFVICDKAYISAKLAIELDDRTHEWPDRQERDREVERILREAGMPLLRLENHGRPSVDELRQQIKDILK
jgi:very-short-patch-repair endonuclease